MLKTSVIETSRQHDWDDIVTCHLGMTGACTWSSDKRAKGKHKLKKDKHNAALVSILFRIISAYVGILPKCWSQPINCQCFRHIEISQLWQKNSQLPDGSHLCIWCFITSIPMIIMIIWKESKLFWKMMQFFFDK